jgi:hypothetical protein
VSLVIGWLLSDDAFTGISVGIIGITTGLIGALVGAFTAWSARKSSKEANRAQILAVDVQNRLADLEILDRTVQRQGEELERLDGECRSLRYELHMERLNVRDLQEFAREHAPDVDPPQLRVVNGDAA